MRKVINEHAFGDNRIDPADPGVQTTWIAYTVLQGRSSQLDDAGARTSRRTPCGRPWTAATGPSTPAG